MAAFKIRKDIAVDRCGFNLLFSWSKSWSVCHLFARPTGSWSAAAPVFENRDIRAMALRITTTR